MSFLTCMAGCVHNRDGQCARPSLALDSTLSDFHDPHYVSCPHYLPDRGREESKVEK